MSIVEIKDNLDLTNFTLDNLNKGKMRVLSAPYNNMPMWDMLYKGGNIRKSMNGTGYELRIDIALADSAAHTSVYGQDAVSRTNTSSKIVAPWRHTQAYLIANETEIESNKGDEVRLLDYYKYLEMKRMQALAVLIERTLWGTPSGSSDELTPYGIPYFIVKNATDGFYGQNPSGFSSVLGIDSSSSSNTYWRNYSGTYSAFTRASLTTKLQSVHSFINWELPVGVPDYNQGTPQFKMFMNWSTFNSMTGMAAEQNDTVGKDIDPFWKTAGFRGIPFSPVSKLEDDTTNPIYFIDMSTIEVPVLGNMWLKNMPAFRDPNAHLNIISYIDCMWNLLINDRRRNAVIYQA